MINLSFQDLISRSEGSILVYVFFVSIEIFLIAMCNLNPYNVFSRNVLSVATLDRHKLYFVFGLGNDVWVNLCADAPVLFHSFFFLVL